MDENPAGRFAADRASVFGPLGGLLAGASLFFPYVSATGAVLGVDVGRVEFTLFDLVDESSDPELVYLVIAVIVGGAALSLLGAVAGPKLGALGGLCEGIGAGAIAYAVATEEPAFAFGFATADLAPEVGLYLLAAAALVSLLALLE